MKKNKLTTAVIAGLAGVAGVASVGNAVHVNPEGTGQVLIYPYYTVNNDLNTAYSVVNTTEDVKAIKVRFLEGEASREVLDFNVYLSPYDVWTGVLVPAQSTTSSHAGENTAMHISHDNSCAPFLTKAGKVFLPFEIDKDAPNNNMQRTTDGHFEILEMGIIDPAFPLHGAAIHTDSGVPASCGALEAAWESGGVWNGSSNAGMQNQTGGLFGGASIIDVANGFNVSYDATALENWRYSAAVPPAPVANHTNPGSLTPNIGEATPRQSIVFNNGVLLTDLWATGVEAVSATLMHAEIYNEYNFEAAVEGKSAWVVTFPTKFHHTVGTLIQPFTEAWDGFEACEEFNLKIYDREEQTTFINEVSPPSPTGSTSFCYEANTVEYIAPGGVIGSSNLLGGNNLLSVEGVPGGTQNGWARVRFDGTTNYMLGTSNRFEGLPVAGFMAYQFTNNNANPGVMAQYGGLFNHKGMVTSGN